MASVKVAVRVRPLNKREKDMDCKVCINMTDMKTTINNPNTKNDVKDFTFDHSYWSVDSRDRHFATQEQVFSNLGTDVIESAFAGYNACIFAYGQTGSGKSYTMMGMQEATGLIPRICEGMYEKMANDQAGSNNKVEFKTEVSYLEIYNERVGDLLRPSPKKGDSFNLKVREHPKDGPYVQDLTKHLVSKYTDIEKLMDIGNEQRTTASTCMNDTSSRSHAIFTLNFTQAKFFTDMPSETVSKIHLVDLAGSERANSTGATGQRLKEGANINKSLVTLGSVISALAEASNQDAKKKTFIPYRDSVLTWLLKDSLGGNAKTIMIAAISPADINYHETLSTLRYANRAKNIINKPTINEDPNVKLIRELRNEINNLRELLQSSNISGNHLAEESKVTERLHQNEAKVEQLTRDWNKKWQETQKIMEDAALAFRREGFGIKMQSDLPHLICVDGDILSTGITMYHLNDGKTFVGREHGQVKQDIVLAGPGIESSHCILESIETNVILHPIAEDCFVNGQKIAKPTRLTQGAVLLLGKTNMFRFNHPAEAAKLRQKYASMENLASIVPAKDTGADAPSYLFYNAGLAMERRYREEARILDEKRKEIEKKQQEDFLKLEEAKKQLEVLHSQKKAEEEEQRKELETTQKQLEKERQSLIAVKNEQEVSREKVWQELQDLKLRILKEQDDEKRKLDDEMNRLLSLKEEHRETMKNKEEELEKQQQEQTEQRRKEMEELEKQKVEVNRLQTEFETSRTEAYRDSPSPAQDQEQLQITSESLETNVVGEERKPSGKELRKKLQVLEETYEEAVKVAQKEVMHEKEALRKAELATVEGKVGLTEGKLAVQQQWKIMDALQAKHNKIQDDIKVEIIALREMLENMERNEEDSLLQRKKSILDRKRARKRVEEATQKLAQMERSMSVNENDVQHGIEWHNKEEVRELADQRKILMELLSKHQVALVKASQLVTETKTKLENHLENEKLIIEPIKHTISCLEHELEPLKVLETQIERRVETYDRDMKERKKTLYKQRKRVTLLEKQHAQTTSYDVNGLTNEEIEDKQNDQAADLELIVKEKVLLKEMETRYKDIQTETDSQINEATKELERRKTILNNKLQNEKSRLQEVTSVHQETTDFVEAELQAREEMLKKVKEKVIQDKRELAKLDMKQQQSNSKAAEDLFMMAEVLEKELGESGKKDELARIRDHRRKLQELDRQLRLAERKEKFTTRAGADGEDPQQCVLL